MVFDGTDQLTNWSTVTLGTHFAFFYHTNTGSTSVAALNGATTNPRFFISLLCQNISTGFSTTFPLGYVRKNLTLNLSSPPNTYNLTSGYRLSPIAATSYCFGPSHSSYARFNGKMFEVIRYETTVSTTDILTIENYLRYKY